MNHAVRILQRLKKKYPVRGPFVEWKTPLQLVVATVLSAQCTDIQVNKVTKELFKKYRTADDFAKARISVLEKEIYSTGFYRTKARHLKGIGKLLTEKYHSTVPDTLEALLTLPGVSYKTAYLVLAKAFGKHVGVAVDTHVRRVAPRLGLASGTDPDTISRELGTIIPKSSYLALNESLIMLGRDVCLGTPRCSECVLRDLCPSAQEFL